MKTKIIFSIISLTCIFLLLSGCKKDEAVKIESLSGFVQKGPFINGSSVMVSDLNSDLSQSGRTFNLQVTDNRGTFELNDILLSSDYVSLRADGFYFNEISGKQSDAQITLYALADISDKSTININVLTHLEKNRIEYLIKNGKSFSEAKAQAEKEILSIFSIVKENLPGFEKLDLTKEGDDNAILLALTSILQGYRTESELTELLAGISTNIEKDGSLDSASLKSLLIDHAVLLDTSAITKNLKKRFIENGRSISLPGYRKYIANFIENSKYPHSDKFIFYPNSKNNILYDRNSELIGGPKNTYWINATIPAKLKLKIKLTALNFETDSAKWEIVERSSNGFSISGLDKIKHTQSFKANGMGTQYSIALKFDPGMYQIDYFENNFDILTRSRTINVLSPDSIINPL